MASTTLFAPQVRDVQPAFIYDIENKKGEVKIYFSFSAYNNINDITHIAFTLIDPNLASGWGSNSMIQGGNKAKIITKSAIENKEFFTIDFFNVQNIDIFKSLNCNQFYQMQLFFINDSTLKEGIIDTNTLLKSDKVSEP